MVVSKRFMVYTLHNLYGGLQFISGNGEATITPENLKLRFLIILIGCMYGICSFMTFTRLGKNMHWPGCFSYLKRYQKDACHYTIQVC